jgi:hypothetical protein
VIGVFVLAGAALTFWCAKVLWSGERTLVAGDIYTYSYPTFHVGFEILRSGTWPLWNPYNLCGLPLLATIQIGVFYPLNVLHLIFPVEQALAWSALAHLVLAGVFMYAYLRSLRLGHLASVVGGLVWSYAPQNINMVLQPAYYGYVWMPLALLGVDRIVRAPSPRNAVLLGAALAMPILAGVPQLFAFTAYALLLYTPIRLLQNYGPNKRLGPALHAIGMLAIGAAVGAGLSAVQVLPTIELTSESTRSLGKMTLEASQFYGTPSPSKLARGLLVPFFPPGIRTFMYTYFGLMPLALAGAGLFWRSHIGTRVFFLLLALLSFGLASGTSGYLYEFFYQLPTGDWFRAPTRFLTLFVLAASALAAIGTERVVVLFTARGPAAGLSGSRLLAVGAAAGLLALIGFDLLNSYGLLGANRLIAHPVRGVGEIRRATQTLALMRERAGLDRVYFLENGRPPDRALQSKRGMVYGLYEAEDYEPMAPRRYVDFFTYAESGKGWPAGEHWSGKYRVIPPLAHPQMLRLTSTRYLLSDRSLERTIGTVYTYALGYSRVDDLPANWDRRLVLYENTHAVPRAYVATQPRFVDTEGEALRSLADWTFDPRREVVLEGLDEETAERLGTTTDPVSSATQGARGRAEIVSYEPNRVTIRAATDRGGFLVLTDLYYPGWRAEIEGQPAEILRANYLFRAVWLAPGEHTVVFRYAPGSFRLGGSITLLTLIAAIVMLAWFPGRRGRSKP